MDKYELLKMKVEYRDGGLYFKSGKYKGQELKGSEQPRGRKIIGLGYKGEKYNLSYTRAVYTLAWGDIPDGFQVDHIDRNVRNNHPMNLRAVTASINCQNRIRKNDSTGLANISWNKNRKVYIVRFRHPEHSYEKSFRALDLALMARDEQCALRGLSFHS